MAPRWNHVRPLSVAALMVFYMAVVVNARNSSKFDRRTCRAEIIAMQQDKNFSMNTPEYFFQDPGSGLLGNGPDNMTLTLRGCDEFCGPWSFYWDAGARFTTWLIPVLLLLSNIELSPIDKKRFMTIVHALGDPIDSFWSLAHKIYIWHRLYAIGLKKQRMVPDSQMSTKERARIIATVLAGFEEICGAKIESEDYYHMITRQLGRLGEADEDPMKFEEWRRTARILADARTNEFLRTCLAIFVYIFGLVAAFIPEIGGGNTTPPGGRIGSAVFLSWLVPLALLSNSVGAFTSRRTCLTVMRLFVWRVARLDDEPGVHAPNSQDGIEPSPVQNSDVNGINLQQMPTPANSDIDVLIEVSSWEHYFESLQWLGAIYTYRPWKVIYLYIDHRTHAHRSNAIMAIVGFLPIAFSMIGAFVILWCAVPRGFSCRHIWVIAIFVAWIGSAAFTSWIYTTWKNKYSGHMLWLIVLAKDALIGLSSVVVIFLSTGGLFNGCWCWSAYISRRKEAYVPLNTDSAYEEDAKKVYSWVVGACMMAHVLYFVGLLLWYRHGMNLVRWTESRRRTEWAHEMNEHLGCTDENYLVFWYSKEQLGEERRATIERHRTWSESQSRPRR